MQYAFFGMLYLWMSDECVEGIERFPHAFFFSVQTSATIGAPSWHDHTLAALPGWF